MSMVGTWVGQYGSPLPPRGVTLEVFDQNAVGDFSGTWANSLGTIGPLTGSIRGDQVVFHWSYQTSTCTGAGDGEGALDLAGSSPRLDFVMSGDDCGTVFPRVLGNLEQQ